jgi:hypothetical protein
MQVLNAPTMDTRPSPVRGQSAAHSYCAAAASSRVCADPPPSRHRSFAAHNCTAAAPRTEGQLRADAAEARRQKAREALMRNFPGFKSK